MVCMDGFILTHAIEGINVPDQKQVDKFLPSFVPRQILDPENPISIGAMVGPEAFTEVRYLAHQKQKEALLMCMTAMGRHVAKQVADNAGLELGLDGGDRGGGVEAAGRRAGLAHLVLARGIAGRTPNHDRG